MRFGKFSIDRYCAARMDRRLIESLLRHPSLRQGLMRLRKAGVDSERSRTARRCHFRLPQLQLQFTEIGMRLDEFRPQRQCADIACRRLGKPLAQMMTIRGSWAYPENKLVKDYSLILTVTHVDDQPLAKAVLFNVARVSAVGRDGTIVYKLVGPVTPENIDTVLKAEIDKALKAGS